MDAVDAAYILIRHADTIQEHNRRRSEVRSAAARRWAVLELANRILNHPKEVPDTIAETFIGQLACMICNMHERGAPADKAETLTRALCEVLRAKRLINA